MPLRLFWGLNGIRKKLVCHRQRAHKCSVDSYDQHQHWNGCYASAAATQGKGYTSHSQTKHLLIRADVQCLWAALLKKRLWAPIYLCMQNFMTGRRLHTHKIFISFQEWIYRVRFLIGWNSGSQPNVSLGPVQRFLSLWLSHIQSSRLFPNQRYRMLMESTEPFLSLPLSAFHIQSLWTFSRCYSRCVFSRLSHFFFLLSFQFIHSTAKIYFSSLSVTMPMFPVNRFRPRTCVETYDTRSSFSPSLPLPHSEPFCLHMEDKFLGLIVFSSAMVTF